MNSLKLICQKIANHGNFDTPVLQDIEGFIPAAETSAAKAMRDTLRLRPGALDYFTTSLAVILVSQPWILQMTGLAVKPSELVCASRLLSLVPPLHSTTPGIVVTPTDNNPQGSLRTVSSWPVSCDIRVQYIAANVVNVICGDRVEMVKAYPADATALYIDWPAWLPFSARLDIQSRDSSWTTSANHADLISIPSDYPVVGMIAAVEKTVLWLPLLQSAGLSAHYTGAANLPLEKAALIAAALTLDRQA